MKIFMWSYWNYSKYTASFFLPGLASWNKGILYEKFGLLYRIHRDSAAQGPDLGMTLLQLAMVGLSTRSQGLSKVSVASFTRPPELK
jgi:hypothetical protein